MPIIDGPAVAIVKSGSDEASEVEERAGRAVGGSEGKHGGRRVCWWSRAKGRGEGPGEWPRREAVQVEAGLGVRAERRAQKGPAAPSFPQLTTLPFHPNHLRYCLILAMPSSPFPTRTLGSSGLKVGAM